MITKIFVGFWQRCKNWWRTRGRFITAIWVAIGVLGGLYVTQLKPEDSSEILKKMQEFADPWLPLVVLLGALIAIGLASLPERSTRTTWPEGMKEELSEAASNFAAVCFVLFGLQIWLEIPIDLDSLRLPLGGLLVAILCCEYKPPEESLTEIPTQPVVAVQEASKTVAIESPTDYGFEFTFPTENEEVGEFTEVRGTASQWPKDGTQVWLFRRWEQHEFECYPLAEILPVKDKDGSFSWTVREKHGYVGGESGKKQKRRFEIWLVGPEGMRVVRHFKKWENYLNDLRECIDIVQGELDERRVDDGLKPSAVRINSVSRAIDITDIPGDSALAAQRIVVRT